MTELEDIVRVLEWLSASKTPTDAIAAAMQRLRDQVEAKRGKTV
jgi:hypothetical protein